MTDRFGVIIQDIAAVTLPEEWPAIAAAGATHALLGLSWGRLQPCQGGFAPAFYWGKIQAVVDAGMTPILRVVPPVPKWAPMDWEPRDQAGRGAWDPERFLHLGMVPSIWATPAWNAIYELQRWLAQAWPTAEFSPPGGGGGEWTHANTHCHSALRDEVAQSLWCFDPHALAAWREAAAAGNVDGDEPPRDPVEAYRRRGFVAWYCTALRGRLGQAAILTPGLPWIGLVPRAGYTLDVLCGGQPGLDTFIAYEVPDCSPIVHCAFGPATDDQTRAYAFHMMREWHGRRIAVGVEGWRGLAENAPRLRRTGCTHLLCGVEDGLVAEGLGQLEFWSRYWKHEAHHA